MWRCKSVSGCRQGTATAWGSLPPLPAPASPCHSPALCGIRERAKINSLPRFTPLEGKAACRAEWRRQPRCPAPEGSPRFPPLAAEGGIGGGGGNPCFGDTFLLGCFASLLTTHVSFTQEQQTRSWRAAIGTPILQPRGGARVSGEHQGTGQWCQCHIPESLPRTPEPACSPGSALQFHH